MELKTLLEQAINKLTSKLNEVKKAIADGTEIPDMKAEYENFEILRMAYGALVDAQLELARVLDEKDKLQMQLEELKAESENLIKATTQQAPLPVNK